MAKEKPHNERLVERAVKDAKYRWGAGWYHLSEDLRQGAIAREIVYIITSWLHQEQNPAVDLCNRALRVMHPIDEEG